MNKILIFSMCFLSACTARDSSDESRHSQPEISVTHRKDPLKNFNKEVLKFNIAMDKIAVRNVSLAYRKLPPRSCISNFLHYLHLPASAIFHLVAFDLDGTTRTVWRFIINSLLGFCGLFDPAKDLFNLEPKEFTFCDVLEKWGIGNSPYLMLPLIGPSSPRDIVGFVGGIFLDPVFYMSPVWFKLSQKPLDTIAARADNFEAVDTIFYKSVSPYSVIRNSYLGNQTDDVKGEDLYLPDI